MPRNSTTGIYTTPAGTDGVSGQTIESAKYNANVHDVEFDLNAPRPVIAGGTGGSTTTDAARNLHSETGWQKIDSYDNQTQWLPGSFFSPTTTADAPVKDHSFAGICYVADPLPVSATDPLVDKNIVIEARDLTSTTQPGAKYVRTKLEGIDSGKWSAWMKDTSVTSDPVNPTDPVNKDYADKTFVMKAGDTMTGLLLLSGDPVAPLGAVTKQYLSSTGPDSAKLVRYDPQTLTVPEQAQARTNIGAAPGDYYAGSLAYNGLQINGAMEISQEFGTAGVPVINIGKYVLDGWMVHAVGSGLNVMCAQIDCTAAGHPLTGFIKCLQITTTLSKSTLAASDMVMAMHQIEGLRIARLGFGTAAAFPVCVGFWIKTHKIGPYSGAVRNTGARSYPFSFSVAAINTWEYKTIVVPGDVTGTWATDGSAGMQVVIAIGLGTDWQGTAGAWASANKLGATGTTNGVGDSDDTTFLTGFHVIPGDQVVLPEHSSFVSRAADAETAQCRRYYYRRLINIGGQAAAGGAAFVDWLPHPVAMRTVPSVALSGGTLTNCGAPTADSPTVEGLRTIAFSSAGGYAAADGVLLVTDARLP